jgi:MFS family permease
VKTIATGYALIGIGMGINGLGASLPMLVVSMIVFTIGEMISMPVSNGYMASLAPDDMRGRYQGVIAITWSSATMIGPALGLLCYHFSPPLLWGSVLTLSLISALLILSTKTQEE